MKHDKSINIVFKNSKKEVDINLSSLINCTIEFLEIYQGSSFAAADFWEITKGKDGETQFLNLLKTAGYENNPQSFFNDILQIVAQGEKETITLQDIPLPPVLLVLLLEKVIPGSGFISIKDTKQLEKATNLKIPEDSTTDLQKVIETYPVRLSHHIIRQMMVSKDVAYQYMPFVEELGSVGFVNTWIGQFHDGLLEQMYENRVIFLLNMGCPVYCRFCFRKHKDSRNEQNPTPDNVAKAVEHIKNSPDVKEIVVTGGDPFMNRANMAATIDGLMQVDHVKTLRLATRSIAYYPDLFLDREDAYLKYLKLKSLELQLNNKRMEVATHFIHPDEVSPQSLEIISDLVNSGIAVYIQTPFLNDCNDRGPELVKLFGMLRGAGAEMHYIYIPCSPIHGNSIYWKALSYGIDMADHLRAHLSDRAIPQICTATPIGKMDWFSSGWAVEKVQDNDNFIWLRTPYTPDYFKSFAPLSKKLDNMRVNKEGTIDIQYMAQLGDESYLIGSRPLRTSEKNRPAQSQDIERLKQELIDVPQTAQSIVKTDLNHLSRLHETRVEIDFNAKMKEIYYIKNDKRITDVVISSQKDAPKDAIDSLFYIKEIVEKLEEIPHVNSIRLKSMKFNTSPQSYTRAVIERLGDLNKLRVVNPLKLEIETWFIQKDELTKEHEKLAQKLNNKGISVYCNVPLLGGVNDSDTAIHEFAYATRDIGIEFHHLYVAGLPLQKIWNLKHPIDSYDVTDIATMVRREGSGREIPRYIILTTLGEVDYGLTSSFINKENSNNANEVKIKLTCYDETYFKNMDETYVFDQDIEIQDGKPVVRVPGLIKTNDFRIS